jgi:hypothetical protein
MGLSGPSKWLTLGTWYWTIRRVYRTATIQFAARGIHTTLCPGNAITVGTLNGGTGIAFPSDTGAHSGFAVYEVTVPILDGEDGAPWLVRAIAGRCSTVDLDDWEFGQVVITLNP